MSEIIYFDKRGIVLKRNEEHIEIWLKYMYAKNIANYSKTKKHYAIEMCQIISFFKNFLLHVFNSEE